LKFQFFPLLIGLLLIALGIIVIVTGTLGYHDVVVAVSDSEKYIVGSGCMVFGIFVALLGARRNRKNDWKL